MLGIHAESVEKMPVVIQPFTESQNGQSVWWTILTSKEAKHSSRFYSSIAVVALVLVLEHRHAQLTWLEDLQSILILPIVASKCKKALC